jgi:hypothetical protein
MNITPNERLNLLLDINIGMTKYSDSNGSDYRPAINDYVTYHTLLDMYDSDYSDFTPYMLWRKKPDEIMLSIIDSTTKFTIDFGWDDLYDSIREYLQQQDFIVDSDELTEEEYNKLMEEI